MSSLRVPTSARSTSSQPIHALSRSETLTAMDPALASEGSVFYKNGLPETAISLKEGRDRLDHLLRDYIRGGEAANVEYDRVVQQIDLHLAQDDLNLVLIDSPGVMFAKEGYSEATRGELEE